MIFFFYTTGTLDFKTLNLLVFLRLSVYRHALYGVRRNPQVFPVTKNILFHMIVSRPYTKGVLRKTILQADTSGILNTKQTYTIH